MHNDRMKPVFRLVCLALAAALTLAGCGGDDDGGSAKDGGSSSSGTTTGSSESGDATPGPGDELALGETAPLTWKPKADLEGSVDVSVDRIDRASIKDFAAFKLDKAMLQSTPYYVHVKAENIGTTNLSGVDLPLFLDNGSDVLFPSAKITAAFKPCPSQPLPKKFTAGKKAALCLVFLAPNKTKLEAIAMRPTDEVEPVTWTGKITRPVGEKKKAKSS